MRTKIPCCRFDLKEVIAHYQASIATKPICLPMLAALGQIPEVDQLMSLNSCHPCVTELMLSYHRAAKVL